MGPARAPFHSPCRGAAPKKKRRCLGHCCRRREPRCEPVRRARDPGVAAPLPCAESLPPVTPAWGGQVWPCDGGGGGGGGGSGLGISVWVRRLGKGCRKKGHRELLGVRTECVCVCVCWLGREGGHLELLSLGAECFSALTVRQSTSLGPGRRPPRTLNAANQLLLGLYGAEARTAVVAAAGTEERGGGDGRSKGSGGADGESTAAGIESQHPGPTR